MFLLAGLGNPGNKYTSTRHNVGFIIIDGIAADQQLNWQSKSKFQTDIAEGIIDSQKIILCKPLTFMNLSGRSIAAIASFYKIPTKNIIIIHDDLDVSLGKIKYKFSGSAAGHNGLKSIISNIGVDYHRLRIGIGRPAHVDYDIADYVLSNLSASEYAVIINNTEPIITILPLLLRGQITELDNYLRKLI